MIHFSLGFRSHHHHAVLFMMMIRWFCNLLFVLLLPLLPLGRQTVVVVCCCCFCFGCRHRWLHIFIWSLNDCWIIQFAHVLCVCERPPSATNQILLSLWFSLELHTITPILIARSLVLPPYFVHKRTRSKWSNIRANIKIIKYKKKMPRNAKSEIVLGRRVDCSLISLELYAQSAYRQ